MDEVDLKERVDTWGDFSQLYHTLSTDQRHSLERAIFARKLGRLAECQQIFDNELSETDLVPVLALEKSILFARLGLERSRFLVLDSALQSRSSWAETGFQRVEDLVHITRAEAHLLAYGMTRHAIQTARRFRDDWAGPALDEWSDVDFGCALAYYSIIKTCYLRSNWIDVATDLNFAPMASSPSRITMAMIVEVLMRRQKWNLALNFIRIHGDFVEDDARILLYTDFLKQCDVNAHPNQQRALLTILDARLSLAYVMLNELELLEEVKPVLDEAGRQLESMLWIQASDQQPSLLVKLQTDKLPVSDTDPVAKLSDLAAAAHVQGDRLLETQILARIKLRLNQVERQLRNKGWQESRHDADRRFAAIHAHPDTNVMLKALVLSGLANQLGYPLDHVASSEYLYKLAEFEATYPGFDVPQIGQDLYRGAARALQALGRVEEANVADARKIQAIEDSSPDPTQFYRKYRDKPQAEWALQLVILLLQWCEIEMNSGALSVVETAQMMHIPVESLQNQNGTLIPNQMSGQSPQILVERLYGSGEPVDADSWEETLHRFESWLYHSPTSVKKSVRHTVLGDLQRARCALVLEYVRQITNDRDKGFDEELQLHVRMLKLRENQRLLELCRSLDRDAMGASASDISNQEKVCLNEMVQLSNSNKAFKIGAVTDNDLLKVQELLEQSLASEITEKSSRLYELSQIASCKAQRYRLFGTLPADAALSAFAEYDEIYTKQRLAKSILKGKENLAARTALTQRWSFTNHYNFALGHCMEAMGIAQVRNTFHRAIRQDVQYLPSEAPPSSRDFSTLMTEFVEWTQKKKARSVSEALGAETILPAAALSRAHLDEISLSMLRQEADLQENIDRAKSDVLELSHAVDAIRNEMRNCANLREIMNLRDGQALNRAQIKSLAESFGPNVTIVDYVHVPTECTALINDIVPMVYRGGVLRSASMVTKNLDLESIRRWVSTCLDKTDLDDPRPLSSGEPVLQMLMPLVEAAVKLSDPGDPIVVCPTDALFRLPLHAIELSDGQTWIERNPIIYTQSLTILRHCHAAAADRDSLRKPEVLAVQALSDVDLALPEAADMAFAARVGARLLQGEPLTKSSFLETAKEADLVHFYGHISSDQPKPLDQYLAIRDLESERVTARDLFGLRLRIGAHVNLIGCGSGHSQVGINDDLLGLSTALLFAGAASIVATLWSIQMDDAAAFQEAFFDNLIEQSQARCAHQEGEDRECSNNRRRRHLDLAVAVQKAVLAIMKDDAGHVRPPYHWAAFFLQGSWNTFPEIQD